MTQKMCDKGITTYLSTIQFVPDRFKNHEMRDKAIDKILFAFFSVPDQYTIQKCVMK